MRCPRCGAGDPYMTTIEVNNKLVRTIYQCKRKECGKFWGVEHGH